MSSMLGTISNEDVKFPENSLIGRGSFASCHRIYLKLDPSKNLVLKLMAWDVSADMKSWLLKHIISEISIMHSLCQGSESFVKIFHLYNEGTLLSGYTMEFCKHGSLRLFSRRLSKVSNFKYHPWLIAQWAQQVSDGFNYLQTRTEGAVGAVLHRDLAVDNVLIDNDIRAKIADFGLSKRALNSIATLRTFDFEGKRGFERRLPETYDDIFRQPDIYGDRYQYGIFVVEAFCQASLRQTIGDRVEDFKNTVKKGKHVEVFQGFLKTTCFDNILPEENKQQLDRLQSIAKEVVLKMVQLQPEARATFAEISQLWRQCDQGLMEAERQRVLLKLSELSDSETLPTSSEKHTVSLGPYQSPKPQEPESDRAQAAGYAGVEPAPPPRAASGLEQQQQPPVGPGLYINIGNVIGDVHTFNQPSGGGAQVPVHQRVAPQVGDEGQILTRKYAEEVADEDLLRRLCLNVQVASRWFFLLNHLGYSALDIERIRGDSTSNDSERLFRALMQPRRPTVFDLGEAFKQCGCLDGLRILLRWERENNLPG